MVLFAQQNSPKGNLATLFSFDLDRLEEDEGVDLMLPVNLISCTSRKLLFLSL